MTLRDSKKFIAWDIENFAVRCGGCSGGVFSTLKDGDFSSKVTWAENV